MDGGAPTDCEHAIPQVSAFFHSLDAVYNTIIYPLTSSKMKNTALLSVDNTKTFEDKNLNELYVAEGEQASLATKKAIELCKPYGITLINVLEEHPQGHVSLAANYTDKNPYDLLTYEEVSNWTPEENGIGERAEFTLSELKSFLAEVKAQMLRPDHSLEGTEGVELTEPLQESDFDLKVLKGQNPAREAYSGFDKTVLNAELKKRGIKKLLITGVATDYCVGQTALDAVNKGYETYLISEATRGVGLESTQAKMSEMLNAGVKIITLNQLSELLSSTNPLPSVSCVHAPEKIVPFSPTQANEKRLEEIPPEMIKVVNDLLIRKMGNSSCATILLKEVKEEFKRQNPSMELKTRRLDFEQIYRKAGRSVSYDQPAYCENYDAYFEFRKKRE
ncbi:MAG: isochorismatase family protein [Candidatus Peribacteria bacterium]|jgi:nicotinamidase-related amidase|nr:isochorismatase family protein [Candidatus Peribacteria bacterium]